MKRLCSIAGLCLLASQVGAQVTTAPVQVEGGTNGIQSFRSKGFETEENKSTTTAITTTEESTSINFDPVQFIYHAQMKVIVHRENGNEQEAIELENKIQEIKKTYNLK